MKIPAVPRPVAALLSGLPQYPHSVMLSAALNAILRGLFNAEDAGRVHGKVVRLAVRDAGIRCTLRIVPGGYAPCGDTVPPDATISASARDFLLLALRKEDPDTLFFDRRLVIEGDTELGLRVKNALDRVDLPLPPHVMALLRDRLS